MLLQEKLLIQMMMMRKFNMKNFFLVLACFLLLSTPISAKNKPKIGDYTFSFYTEKFSQELFPNIKKRLSNYRKILNKTESQNITNEVYGIIVRYITKNELPILIKPEVKLFKMQNEENVAFVIDINLVLADGEETNVDLISTLVIKKTFLIYIQSRITLQTTEI